MHAKLTPLIDALFAGVLAEPPWADFLRLLEQALPCKNATIVLRMPKQGAPGVVISTTGSEWSLSNFQSQTYGPNFLQTLPYDQVHIIRQRYSAAELERQTYFSRYLQRLGIDDIICLNLIDPDSGMIFRLRATREQGEPRFGARDREMLQGLVPRLRIAIAIYARIALQQFELHVQDDLASGLEVGSILLGRDGKVLKVNSFAKRLLELRDGLHMKGDTLCSSAGEVSHSLQSAVHRILDQVPYAAPLEDITLRIPRSPGGATYWSVLCRCVADEVGVDSAAAPAVQILIRKGGQKIEVSVGALTRSFRFTKAEANLALKLVAGSNLNEAAKELGISRYTARCQLSAMFTKTDCHRQSQLVGLILNTINSVWPSRRDEREVTASPQTRSIMLAEPRS